MAMEISDYGHVYATTLSSSALTPSSHYAEQLLGLSQVNNNVTMKLIASSIIFLD